LEKVYTIARSDVDERVSGTLEELITRFKLTLVLGNSRNQRISLHPKDARRLVKHLNMVVRWVWKVKKPRYYLE
jgi:hypothetical protein